LFELRVASYFWAVLLVVDPFFLFCVRVFVFPRLFQRTLYQRLTWDRERLFGMLLFQYFSGTAHSFSWIC
jgi:hypothetical protein